MEAHSAGTSNNEGDTRKRERTPREAIPAADKLTESESIAREWEEDRKEHRGRVASRREPSLAELPARNSAAQSRESSLTRWDALLT